MTPLYLVDGFNLLHAAVLRGRDRREWWRAEQQARVVALAEPFPGGEVWVIFDARGSARSGGSARVAVQHAADADARILELCAELRELRRVVVVTADRSLMDRARHRGASQLSPWQFAKQCAAARLPADECGISSGGQADDRTT